MKSVRGIGVPVFILLVFFCFILYSNLKVITDYSRLYKYLKPPSGLVLTNRNSTVKSYSQESQDAFVYDNFPIEHGFFIEMGAYDGQNLSNTLWLEQKYGWTGLLIEANHDLCKRIDSLLRNAWRLCACISDKTNEVFVQSDVYSGLHDSYNKHVSAKERKGNVIVPCFNLQTVLNKIGRNHINYFSLDIEGGEIAFLETIKDALRSREIVVDIWTIEYAVYKGESEEYRRNLENYRNYFEEVGGYLEHSELGGARKEGLYLDIVFVYTETWCNTYHVLPDKRKCDGQF